MTFARKIIVWLIFAIIGVLVWMVYVANSHGAELKLKTPSDKTIIVTDTPTTNLKYFEFTTNLITWQRCYNVGVTPDMVYTQTGIDTNLHMWLCRSVEVIP